LRSKTRQIWWNKSARLMGLVKYAQVTLMAVNVRASEKWANQVLTRYNIRVKPCDKP